MAYLGKYIRQILSRNEAVILPGFGSLVIVQNTGGSVTRGAIDPPGTNIKFDARHPKDDGMLAAAYASGEGIDPEEARQQVLELVDAIKFKLDKGEQYMLELVGKFSRDDDNKIHFEKDPNWIIDPELFGLSAVDLLEIEEIKEETEKIEPVFEPVKEEKIKQEQPEKEAVKKKRVRGYRKPVNKWRIIWIVIASLIAVLVLILLLPAGEGFKITGEGARISSLKDSDSSGQSKPRVKTPIAIEGNEQDVKKPDTGNAGEVQDAGVKDTDTETATGNAVVGGSYCIIVGSLTKQAAYDYVSKLKANGYPAEVIEKNGRYRVSLYSYQTEAEAYDKLRDVKIIKEWKDAWVTKR